MSGSMFYCVSDGWNQPESQSDETAAALTHRAAVFNAWEAFQWKRVLQIFVLRSQVELVFSGIYQMGGKPPIL